MGMTPEEIVATYPTITLPAVHAALAYYYGHRAEIDSAIADDERFVDDMETKAATSPLSLQLASVAHERENLNYFCPPLPQNSRLLRSGNSVFGL
jgi:hypothetical protein